MAPILFCKCSQCICTATVLINKPADENRGSSTTDTDALKDISETTRNSSNHETFETEATSSFIHTFVSEDSKGSPEVLFFTLIIVLILIGEWFK